MPRVRLYFGLRARDGSVEFTLGSGPLCEVLARLSERVPGVVEDCGPAPGHLIFLNRVDIRLLPNDTLVNDEDVIDVVPVNHPG